MRRIETNLNLLRSKPERSGWERRELTQPSAATSTGRHWGDGEGWEGREEGTALRRSQLLKLSPSPTHQEALLPGDSLGEECELPR